MLKRYFLLLPVLAFTSCFKSEPVTQPAPHVNQVLLNTNFNIPLPENHSTGYIWQLDDSYDKNTVDYINAVWHGNEKGVIFNFESKGKGKTDLLFRLIKYKDTLETKTFIVEVK